MQECAEMVRTGDPERFSSAMSAPPEKRGGLMVIYAFNLEIARIPWVTKEPMIAEMRLQWWRDTIETIFDSNTIPSHTVANPLAHLIHAHSLPRLVFDQMITARIWDIYREPHTDIVAFDRYIHDTAGAVMELGCRVLGAVPNSKAVADFGFGHGVSLLLQATPKLEQLGRRPLVDDSHQGIVKIAERALTNARKGRLVLKNDGSDIRPALRSSWNAGAVLKRAINNPALVAAGELEASPARKRLSLLVKAWFDQF